MQVRLDVVDRVDEEDPALAARVGRLQHRREADLVGRAMPLGQRPQRREPRLRHALLGERAAASRPCASSGAPSRRRSPAARAPRRSPATTGTARSADTVSTPSIGSSATAVEHRVDVREVDDEAAVGLREPERVGVPIDGERPAAPSSFARRIARRWWRPAPTKRTVFTAPRCYLAHPYRWPVLSVCCLSGGPPGRLSRPCSPCSASRGRDRGRGLDERVDLRRLGAGRRALRRARPVPVRRAGRAPARLDARRSVAATGCSGSTTTRSRAQRCSRRSRRLDQRLTHALVPAALALGGRLARRRPLGSGLAAAALPRPRPRSFPGVMHVPIRAHGQHAYLDAPLYHLDLVANTREQREAQGPALRAAVRRGLRLGGLPFNTAFYLPELHPSGSRSRSVPADDAALVAARCAWRLRPPKGRGRSPRLATRDEIDAHWADAPLPDSDYRARLELGPAPHPVAGELRKIDVRRDQPRQPLLARRRTTFPRSGSPTASRAATGRDPDAVPAPGRARRDASASRSRSRRPAEPGPHTLVVDLVHERHRWFGCETAAEVTVAPLRRAVVLVGQPPGDPEFDGRVDEALAALDPALEPFLVGPKPDWLRDRFRLEAAAEPPDWPADAVVELPAGRRRDRIRLALLARRLRRRARGQADPRHRRRRLHRDDARARARRRQRDRRGRQPPPRRALRAPSSRTTRTSRSTRATSSTARRLQGARRRRDALRPLRGDRRRRDRAREPGAHDARERDRHLQRARGRARDDRRRSSGSSTSRRARSSAPTPTTSARARSRRSARSARRAGRTPSRSSPASTWPTPTTTS